jgi:hypothetical protein
VDPFTTFDGGFFAADWDLKASLPYHSPKMTAF